MTEEVSREHPDKSISVEFMPLDLASLRSVKRFTEDYKQKGLPLHLLINNAGIGSVPFGECFLWFSQGHVTHQILVSACCKLSMHNIVHFLYVCCVMAGGYPQ